MAHILLVEPYYSGSHRAWADGFAASSRHQVGLITHAADFWRWRLRGSAVTLAEDAGRYVADHGMPDALLVSDMTDLAGFLGFTRGVFAHVPVGLFVHENQLLYPLGPQQQPDEALSLVNWRSLLAADSVWFNSAFQRDGLLAELPRFLKRQIDHTHGHLIEGVIDRSGVLPVGVHTAALIDAPRTADPDHPDGPLVLWNQRWDHDKNPAAVFRALVKLAKNDVPFRFALAGENQRVDPQEFQRVQDDLGERVVHVGHLPRDQYRDLLLRADVVVSAAHHEFFGISIVEAIAAGAVPVLPDRQSYPEVVPAEWHDAVLFPDGDLYQRTHAVVSDVAAAQQAIGGLRESMRQYDWVGVAAQYDDALDELISGGRRGHGI